MPVRKSIKERMGEATDASPKQTGDHAPDEMSKKVSRLATATSISAFVATACLIFSFVTHAQASSVVAEVQSDLVSTVVASKSIPKGSVVKDDMVRIENVPSRYLGKGTFTSVDEVVGKQSNVEITENSQLQSGMFTGDGNNASLSAKLSKGKKAVSIDVTTETDFACSLLHQGDHVSLYCFKGSKDGNRTKIELAKDVEVLALDGCLSYSELTGNGKASYSNVTVEVDQSTALEIRNAQDSDKAIWMVLTSDTDAKR